MARQTEEIKFIKHVLTPQNPKDIYHINYEDALRNYLVVLLISLLMIFYWFSA